ncbi:hypothetical protein STAN_1824 [Streptomyces sp. CBMAI 2042]|uniref:hypothetical protein n=1 Tax=Streptomyces sp. CBMAI 2042 TaxID=2305222 RepID=UPI000F2AEEF0|nr:hypothetical protein [Streptomyces sp. CBMAI 2042]RLV66303.1 hypothetical protein STAN_1824 [Streptomyces sp. CBMAI 2042]
MPELTTRRAWLAVAIQTEPAPVTTHRAAELLAASPWPTSGRNTARKDLRALAARGVLAAVDAAGRRTYTTTSPERSAA